MVTVYESAGSESVTLEYLSELSQYVPSSANLARHADDG